MSTKALERHLLPLNPYLEMDGVTEICLNQPQELYVECNRKFIRYEVPELEFNFLNALAGLIAEFNAKDFPHPLIFGSLPNGERIQFVMNPASENNKIIFSIRKPQLKEMTLDDYAAQGVFNHTSQSSNANDLELKNLLTQNKILEFIELAILSKKNILISGGTGTGKTTFLNACLQLIPDHERIITVEDTREVKVKQPNVVHLLFNEEDARINSLKVFKTCLRLCPDRLFLSELRGSEVWPYLRAANSGHPGSLSTIHADSPAAAFSQLVFMMQQAGSTSNEEQLRNYIKSIIHIVIQLKRSAKENQFVTISEIYFDPIPTPMH